MASLALILALVLLIVLMVSGAPFYVAFGGFSVLFLAFYADFPAQILGAEASGSVASFTLIALPLFILLGNIMSRIGAAGDLFDLARAFVGHLPGGMGVATVVTATGFGAMSGSGLATSMAVSSVAVPELTKYGYKRSTVASICAAAGGLGLIIPPSLGFIVLAEVLQVSVGALFMAGIIPGLIASLILSLVCVTSAVRDPSISRIARVGWDERLRALRKAGPAFIIPLAIVLSIYLGIATPTETAAIACAVSIVLGYTVYRTLSWNVLKLIMRETARSTGSIWMVIMGALMLGRAVSVERIPQSAARLLSGLNLDTIPFVLVALLAFFILGMFFDAFVLSLAALPPLVLSLQTYNINLIWFAVLFQLMIVIGQMTPPVGITLYAAASGAGASSRDTIVRSIPYTAALVAATLIVVFIPATTLI